MNRKKLLACFISVFFISACSSLRSIAYAQDFSAIINAERNLQNYPQRPAYRPQQPQQPQQPPDNEPQQSSESPSDADNDQGCADFSKKDYADAYVNFLWAMENDTSTPFYRWNAAKAAWGQAAVAFNNGDWAGAINLYQNALALFYDNPVYQATLQHSIGSAENNLGNVFYKNGDFTDAISLYQDALTLDDDPADKIIFQGNAANAEREIGVNAYDKGDWAGAIKQFQKALALDNNPADQIALHNILIIAEEAAYPNTVWYANGGANAADGYQWANPNDYTDYTVVPIPAGTPNVDHPNTVWDGNGKLEAVSGYQFTIPNDPTSVKPIPAGTPDADHPNTIWDGSAHPAPADGYQWTNSSDPSAANYVVQPIPAGTPDADHPNTVWDGNGKLTPVSGYQFADPSDPASIEPIPAGTVDADHPNTVWDGSAHPAPALGYQWASTNGPADNNYTVNPIPDGTPDSDYPNVVWNGHAQLHAADGYQWTNFSDPSAANYVVQPIPAGTSDADHPNTVWDGSAKLVPAPGYQWVNANGASDDFNVQPIPADTIDPDHPATVWDGKGNIIAAPGYQWADTNGPVDKNFSVNPIPAGTPDADHSNTVWDGTGTLTPAGGYQWDSFIDPNDYSVVPVTATGGNPISLSEAYQQAEDLVHNFRLKVQVSDQSPVAPDSQTPAANPPTDMDSLPIVDDTTTIADLSDYDWDPSFSDDPDQSVPLPMASPPPPANFPASVVSSPADSVTLQTQVDQQIARFQSQLARLKNTQLAWQTALRKLQSGQNYQAELDEMCKESQKAQWGAVKACLSLLTGEAGPIAGIIENNSLETERLWDKALEIRTKMVEVRDLLAQAQAAGADAVPVGRATAYLQILYDSTTEAIKNEKTMLGFYKNLKTFLDTVSKLGDCIMQINDTKEKQTLLLTVQNLQDFVANQIIFNPEVQDIIREHVNDWSLEQWQKAAGENGMKDVASYASLGKFAIDYGYEAGRFYMAWNGVNETLKNIDDQNRIAHDMQYNIVQSTNEINQVKAQLAALQAASGNDQQSRQVLNKIQQQDRIQAYEAALMLPDNSVPAQPNTGYNQ
jgi:tetratricopeptide (TPR) repeat protein